MTNRHSREDTVRESNHPPGGDGSGDIEIRPAVRSDLESMMRLLNAEILGGVNIFRLAPITAGQADKWWNLHGHGRYRAVVASRPERQPATAADPQPVLGWATLAPHSAYEGYDRTAEVSVWVDASIRRHGCGRKLLQYLLDTCPQHNIRTVISRIEANNTASLQLHRRCGFQPAGLLRDVGEKMGQSLSVALWQYHVDENQSR